MLEKLKQKMLQQKVVVGEAILDLVKDKVSKEVQEKRFNICLSCDKLYKPTLTCKRCGCFMNVKTWMPKEKCPLDKWGREVEKS